MLYSLGIKNFQKPFSQRKSSFPVGQFGYFPTPSTSFPLAITRHLHFDFIIVLDLDNWEIKTVKEVIFFTAEIEFD